MLQHLSLSSLTRAPILIKLGMDHLANDLISTQSFLTRCPYAKVRRAGVAALCSRVIC